MTDKHAFTLIELLLVIFLSFGAVAFVFVSSKPFEKIKEARDNDMMYDSKELLSAFSSYKSQFGNYPFLKNPDKTLASDEESGLKKLVEKKEIREYFLRRSNLDSIYLSVSGEGRLLACFNPESKKVINEAAYSKTQSAYQDRCLKTGVCFCTRGGE